MLNYENLVFDGKLKQYDSRSIELIKAMCSVYDCNNRIIIAHPNRIFQGKPINKDNKELNNIDWKAIDPESIEKFIDSFESIGPDPQKAYRYIHRKLHSEILKLQKLDRVEPRFLGVVEQDDCNNYMVRGIFRAEPESLGIAMNPEYDKYRAKSIWDKELRLNDDYAEGTIGVFRAKNPENKE